MHMWAGGHYSTACQVRRCGELVYFTSPSCRSHTYFVQPSCGGRPSNSGKGVTGGLGGCKSSMCGLVGTMVPLVK